MSYVPGAAIVVRVEAFDSIGGFDERLRFGEDVDLVWRLDEQGWRCRYEPASTVWHRPRPGIVGRMRQHAGYGTSAAPLALRHPGALAPMRTNGWTAAAWALLLAGHPVAAVTLAVGSAGALVPKLPDVPPAAAFRLAMHGHLGAARAAGVGRPPRLVADRRGRRARVEADPLDRRRQRAGRPPCGPDRRGLRMGRLEGHDPAPHDRADRPAPRRVAETSPRSPVPSRIVRLSIRTARWRAHVAQVAASTPGLVPVVKGNGYGFGREWLAEVAAEFADTIAVGTIHELEGLPASVTPVVLTPTLVPPTIARQKGTEPVLTIGNDSHLAALAGWDGRVVVKLASGMQRFGGTTGARRRRSRRRPRRGRRQHPPATRRHRRRPCGRDHAVAPVRRPVAPRLGQPSRRAGVRVAARRHTRTATASGRRCGTATRARCTCRPRSSSGAPCMAASGRAITSARCPATVTS